MNAIEAKVAAIFNDRSIALNAGTDQSVSVGDTVFVFDEVTVKDPDSGEELGIVMTPKLRLRVDHVQERLSTAVVSERIDDDAIMILPSLGGNPLKRISTAPVPSKDWDKRVQLKVGDYVEVERPKKSK